MPNYEFVDGNEDEEYFSAEFLKKVNQPRRDWRKQVQEELDDLGDLYDLPENLQVPGVRL